MKLVIPNMIPEIDKYASDILNIPSAELIARSGRAIARAIRARIPKGKILVFLVGKGNNGADGIAAAIELLSDFSVTVALMFEDGQRSEEGTSLLERLESLGSAPVKYEDMAHTLERLKTADCIVDAVFGTGYNGRLPEHIIEALRIANENKNAFKVAVDVPLGVDAESGRVEENALKADLTVILSYIKVGLVSYPAREYVGEIVSDTIGLPDDEISKAFRFKYCLTDEKWARDNLPERPKNSNKGTFGSALIITGSNKYRGAAHLSLEAALRGGVGRVGFVGTPELSRELRAKFPEVIYHELNTESPTDEDIEEIKRLSRLYSVTLVGSGSSPTPALQRIVKALLLTEGTPLILDADAINVLADEEGRALIKAARRSTTLTPHPLEFARLLGLPVAKVQSDRLALAESFAEKYECTIVLKGAATVTAGADMTYINTSATSALAKAGSGDVLAGLVAALAAQMPEVSAAAALAVKLHSLAAERLEQTLSPFGVTPSDIGKEFSALVSETRCAPCIS